MARLYSRLTRARGGRNAFLLGERQREHRRDEKRLRRLQRVQRLRRSHRRGSPRRSARGREAAQAVRRGPDEHCEPRSGAPRAQASSRRRRSGDAWTGRPALVSSPPATARPTRSRAGARRPSWRGRRHPSSTSSVSPSRPTVTVRNGSFGNRAGTRRSHPAASAAAAASSAWRRGRRVPTARQRAFLSASEGRWTCRGGRRPPGPHVTRRTRTGGQASVRRSRRRRCRPR